MNIIQNLIGKPKQVLHNYTNFRELGGYQAIFAPFGKEIYSSELVRACVRPLAEHTAKANPKSSDKRLENVLMYRPNQFMNGKDFLSKCRNILEVKNTLFVYLNRDDKGRVISLYPVPYQRYEGLQYNGKLFIKFSFNSNAMTSMVASWDDLAVLRKDYLFSDIGGEDNKALLPDLELIFTTNQGVANAVKATANLRGILKNTKAMLDSDMVKKQKDQFVKDYLTLENSGGIASLDPTQEFIPIKMEPAITTPEQMKEFRENLYRYFGVSEEIIQSKADESAMEAFYTSRIEPFLLALSLELTSKCFTQRELGFGAFIQYESSRLQFASAKTKLELVQLVDRGVMTPNEMRAVFNMAPVDGGDVPIRRLDTAPVEEVVEEGESNES